MDKLSKYEILGKGGKGAYGVVEKAQHKDTLNLVALKKIKLESEDEGIPSTAIREIALLKELHHPNIVTLQDIVLDSAEITLVFEYLDQDLGHLIEANNREPLDMPIVKSYMKQILEGLAYCHKNKVLHRDLKPQNLLVNKDGVLKLADFGLARAFGIPVKNYTHNVVTLWYRSPDVLMGSQTYSTHVDMWSVGGIFAEMVGGKPLFHEDTPEEQLEQIFKVMGTPDPEKWEDMRNLPNYSENIPIYEPMNLSELVPNLDDVGMDLLLAFLQGDPSLRISAADALKHPFLENE